MKIDTAIAGVLQERGALQNMEGTPNPSYLSEHMHLLSQYNSILEERVGEKKKELETREAELFKKYRKEGKSVNASEVQTKYDVVEDLIDLKTNKDEFTFRGSSAGEFLQCILSDVAINASNANTFYLNYTNLSSAIETQRMSVSGVDKDEEALNLVKYQNSYTLASKMIQTLSECYDRLILQTGV